MDYLLTATVFSIQGWLPLTIPQPKETADLENSIVLASQNPACNSKFSVNDDTSTMNTSYSGDGIPSVASFK